MHELSLCRAIADTAMEHANDRPIERIRLQIGHFRQVVPDTLQFCWRMRTENTQLADCVLEVDHIPAIVECGVCEAVTELEHPVLRCGSCDSASVTLTSGEEFLIESIDVAPAPMAPETNKEIH